MRGGAHQDGNVPASHGLTAPRRSARRDAHLLGPYQVQDSCGNRARLQFTEGRRAARRANKSLHAGDRAGFIGGAYCQLLAHRGAVAPDTAKEVVDEGQYLRTRPEVRLEAYYASLSIRACPTHFSGHKVGPGIAKPVDGLLHITHKEPRRGDGSIRLRKKPDYPHLHGACILKLIHHDMSQLAAVSVKHFGVGF